MPPVFNISLEAILRGCVLNHWMGWREIGSKSHGSFPQKKHGPLKHSKRLNLFFEIFWASIDHAFLDVDHFDPDLSHPGHWKVGQNDYDQPWLFFEVHYFEPKPQPNMGDPGDPMSLGVLSSNLLFPADHDGYGDRANWMTSSLCITLPGFLCHSPYQTTLTFNWGQFTPRKREWLEMGARFST